MPFTHNRYFKQHPRLIVGGKGAYYDLADGRHVFDCLSGLWCCPMGHAHPGIVKAVQEQVETLDFSPSFQMGHPPAFSLAARIARMAKLPDGRVFFVNSGSEAVDTALKVAIAYHRARGEASRFRIIGRERGYHGVGLGGISVGGIAPNRKAFAPLMMSGVDHLPHTYSPKDMAYSKGQPEWGAHLAEELERLVALHDASTIAAVIVEPMQGSTGVIVPPRGYLERLREICTKHGILLIFDEVITGFGRLGKPFGSEYFGVSADLTTFAKAVTNGVVPMGGVIVRPEIYEAFMSGPAHAIELFHGYTYSGHPLAVAAGHASLDALEQDGLIERAADSLPCSREPFTVCAASRTSPTSATSASLPPSSSHRSLVSPVSVPSNYSSARSTKAVCWCGSPVTSLRSRRRSSRRRRRSKTWLKPCAVACAAFPLTERPDHELRCEV